jgi:dTDP-4-amino-4,6-dideoxygalactose transaminase
MKAIPRGNFYHTVLQDIKFIAEVVKADKKHESNTVAKFERAFAEYVDRQACISFSLARTALFYLLKSLDLPRGSKILITPITIKAMLDVMLDLGLDPILVDLDPDTGFINLESLKQRVSENADVKLCFLTYLFGITPELVDTVEYLEKKQIVIVEDFSQCLNGVSNAGRVGTLGLASVFSASSVKTLDTHGGGFVVTDDFELSSKLRAFQNSLTSTPGSVLLRKSLSCLGKNILSRNPIFTLFIFPIFMLFSKFNSSLFIRFFGQRSKSPISELPREWFYKYSGVQAKFALSRLPEIHSKDIRRIEIAKRYRNEIVKYKFLASNPESQSVYWQFIILPKDPNDLMNELRRKKIDTAMSSLVLFSKLNGYGIKGKTPNADYIYEHAVYIPCHPNLTDAFVARVVASLNR